VSISHFPGAVNADLSGYAGSFWQRLKGLLGTCICFILSGGDLEALTEDLRHEEASNTRALRSEAQSSAQLAQRQVRQNTAFSSELDPDEPSEPSKVYHRAITSLCAGTDPDASQLNGKVRVIRPPELSRLTGHVKYLFQYLTAWARLTLPSKKALNSQLGTRLWDWCEEQVKKDTKVNEDVKVKEDTEAEEDTMPKVEAVTKVVDVTKPKVEDITKVVDVTKAEEGAKPKEDAKVEEGAKVEEVTKADEATTGKAKEDTEAKEDTKSKE